MQKRKDIILITELAVLAVILIFGIFMVSTVCGGINEISEKLQNMGSAKSEPLPIASDFRNADTKNNLDLVFWAENAYEQKWGYVYGTWGSELTGSLLSEKAKQYPQAVGGSEKFIKENYIGRRVTDCIGLIKGYGWYNNNGGFSYCSNGMPDVGADRLFNEASEKGEIGTIPDIPGLAVWAEGHIGVYIGDGWVIDAKGTEEGMMKTRVEDRAWTHWCRIPYIEYIDE